MSRQVMEHLVYLDYCRHWRPASVVMVQAISAAAVQGEARLHRVVMAVEKRELVVVVAEESMVDLERVVQEVRLEVAGATVIFVQRVTHMAKKELREHDGS